MSSETNGAEQVQERGASLSLSFSNSLAGRERLDFDVGLLRLIRLNRILRVVRGGSGLWSFTTSRHGSREFRDLDLVDLLLGLGQFVGRLLLLRVDLWISLFRLSRRPCCGLLVKLYFLQVLESILEVVLNGVGHILVVVIKDFSFKDFGLGTDEC